MGLAAEKICDDVCMGLDAASFFLLPPPLLRRLPSTAATTTTHPACNNPTTKNQAMVQECSELQAATALLQRRYNETQRKAEALARTLQRELGRNGELRAKFNSECATLEYDPSFFFLFALLPAFFVVLFFVSLLSFFFQFR